MVILNGFEKILALLTPLHGNMSDFLFYESMKNLKPIFIEEI